MADLGKNSSRAIIKIDPKILALYQEGPYDASRQKRFKFNVDVIPLELMYRELGIEVPDVPCIPEPYIKEYVTDEQFKAAAERALEKAPEFKKEVESRKLLAELGEKTPQASEPSTRSVQEKVVDSVSKLKDRSTPKEVLARPQEENQPVTEVSLIDFDDATIGTEEDDHSSNYETPANKHDETLHLPKMKIVRTGQATFHASQAGLENFLSDKDFEFTDEEFLEQAANVDDKLTIAKTKQEVQEVVRDSIPFLIKGIRRIVAQSKLKLDSIGESQKLDQLLQEERKQKLKFQSEFNEMRKKCEAAHKERDTALYKNRALSDSLQNYRDKSDTDKKEYDKLLEEFQQLKDGNRELENAAKELQRENENLRASRSSKVNQQAEAELQKQNQKLTGQNQRLRTELQQQRDAYAELQKKNGQDVNEIESLRRQLKEEQKRINPSVDYVAELQQELATVKSENEMYLSSSQAATSAVTKDREETLLAMIEQYKIETAAEKAEKEILQKERRLTKDCAKCINAEKEMREAQAAAFHTGAACAEMQEEIQHYRNQHAAREVHFESEAPLSAGDINSPSRKDLYDHQIFEPSDSNLLLSQHQCRTTNGWNDRQTCQAISGALKGASYIWFAELYKDNPTRTWNRFFKQALIRHFNGASSKAEMRRAMNNRHCLKEESVRTYMDSFMMWFKELRIEEEEQVEVLLEGLKKHRPGWYATLYRNRPESYEEFEAQVQDCEKLQKILDEEKKGGESRQRVTIQEPRSAGSINDAENRTNRGGFQSRGSYFQPRGGRGNYFGNRGGYSRPYFGSGNYQNVQAGSQPSQPPPAQATSVPNISQPQVQYIPYPVYQQPQAQEMQPVQFAQTFPPPPTSVIQPQMQAPVVPMQPVQQPLPPLQNF
ncbi:periplakin-like [Paramacrobiotus metropolitanus]|uniref:periplakin-like n=1 Tax=Paramacrobiotus metropolitanus TaxID=2943436 RepID=UPI0024456851|nr:periplakin-like [Paramacrobiotus metropolitanus]